MRPLPPLTPPCCRPRPLRRRHIVRLRGVGASDLADLVAMRESMVVVQVRG